MLLAIFYIAYCCLHGTLASEMFCLVMAIVLIPRKTKMEDTVKCIHDGEQVLYSTSMEFKIYGSSMLEFTMDCLECFPCISPSCCLDATGRML
jgi:hypothetical protein